MPDAKAVEFKNKGNKEYVKGTPEGYKTAIELYTKAIDTDPQEHTFYTNRSAAYMGLNKFEEALADAEKSLQIKNDWSKGYYRKGLACLSLMRFDDAYYAFDEARKLDPTSEEIKKRCTEADKERRKPKKVGPDGKPLPAWLVAKEEGNFLYKEGQFTKAVEAYTKGIALCKEDSNRIILLGNRAACRLQQECQDFKLVIEDCTEILKFEPKNSKALTRRGQAYEALEKYKLALQDMKDAVAADPTNMRASQAIHRINRVLM